MSIFNRVIEQTSGNQTGGVGHVDHEQSTHLVGDFAHALVIPLAAVGRATADDELGLVLQGQLLHLVVVNTSSLTVEVVANRIVKNTAGIDARTV